MFGNKDEALISASRHGKVGKVARLVASGANIDFEDENNWTALQIAAGENRREVFETLIGAGADVSKVMREGDTALIWLSRQGRDWFVKQMLSAGAEVNFAQEHDGKTALHTGVTELETETVRMMLDCGANPDPVNKAGITPLALAADAGKKDTAALLVERGADITKALEGALTFSGDRAKRILEYLASENGVAVNPALLSGHSDEDYTLQDDHTIMKRDRYDNGAVTLKTIFNFKAREVTTITSDNGVGNTQLHDFDAYPFHARIEEAKAALIERGGTIPEHADAKAKTAKRLKIG